MNLPEVGITRLEAQVKMGYYPTPGAVVERLRSFLQFPAGNVNLLDPCCGEGLALQQLAGEADATTYGIELDDARAEQSRDRLDYVLAGDYEDARLSPHAFSALLLNPPYDWEAGVEEGVSSERQEGIFLRNTLRYLQPAGVLIYIVSQPRVTEDLARLLAYRCADFQAYRFMEEEYQPFRQVALFGVKKGKNRRDDGNLAALRALPREDLGELPYAAEPSYRLPPAEPVRVFRSTRLDEGELERELPGSPLWAEVNRDYGASENGLGRPPLPLHRGHLGLLLAAGQLDGVVGEGEDRHVVRGKVEKHLHTYEEIEGGRRVERQVERYQVSLKVLTRDGQIRTLG